MTERLEFELTLDGVQAAQAQLDKFKKFLEKYMINIWNLELDEILLKN